MPIQTVFQRYELKYIITQPQRERIQKAMEPYMAPDQYGRTVIRNIYYDTENYRLVRKSIERGAYKEKLRIRSYSRAAPNSTVFVELKRKYDSIVYKRRLPLTEEAAMDLMDSTYSNTAEAQISNEIGYFLSYYKTLRPVAFLSYEREAYYSRGGDDFRITFDDTVLCRQEELSLRANIWGTPLLDAGLTLMEIKCSGGIPLWLTSVLSREHIYKTSFSKYGNAYERLIYPKLRGTYHYA